jgi:hypothetical protein
MKIFYDFTNALFAFDVAALIIWGLAICFAYYCDDK